VKKIATTLVLAVLTVGAYAQFSNPGDDIPAYNALPPAKGIKIPAIMSGQQLTGEYFRYPWQVKVYQAAAKIPAVLFQLPCYCHCDRSLGHNSLHSCFEGTHGAACGTCAKEAFFAYQMTKTGKTPKQIREAIEHQDYQSVDLENASL
jgi:Protein of unknown function with PCYCGC motif